MVYPSFPTSLYLQVFLALKVFYNPIIIPAWHYLLVSVKARATTSLPSCATAILLYFLAHSGSQTVVLFIVMISLSTHKNYTQISRPSNPRTFSRPSSPNSFRTQYLTNVAFHLEPQRIWKGISILFLYQCNTMERACVLVLHNSRFQF